MPGVYIHKKIVATKCIFVLFQNPTHLTFLHVNLFIRPTKYEFNVGSQSRLTYRKFSDIFSLSKSKPNHKNMTEISCFTLTSPVYYIFTNVLSILQGFH